MRAEIGRTGIAFGTDSSLRPGRTPFSFADIIESPRMGLEILVVDDDPISAVDERSWRSGYDTN